MLARTACLAKCVPLIDGRQVAQAREKRQERDQQLEQER